MFQFQPAIPLRWHLHLTTAVHHVPQDQFGTYLFVTILGERARGKVPIHCDSHSKIHLYLSRLLLYDSSSQWVNGADTCIHVRA